ncbi:MAG: PIN domain nuclease [Candidatus Pacebacteria bacterium CG10_big_fil_rev_8_21_14_0_10_56_10]|nr:MAG: PIN domain nuclease [Candidatus Pacebacteria bacterium CG10_big_fil_rev_8_21_14_0_10_56_10]
MILLDTVTFLWVVTGSSKLSKKAEELYLNENNKVYLSSISVWEIVIKYKLGKLPLPEKPDKYIPAQRKLHGVEPLPLEEDDVVKLEKLKNLHSDPFDRMLVCQAIARDFVIVTPDRLIRQYSVKTVW